MVNVKSKEQISNEAKEKLELSTELLIKDAKNLMEDAQELRKQTVGLEINAEVENVIAGIRRDCRYGNDQISRVRRILKLR